MNLHGKGKIFFRQNIHIYSRISWNLEDEIFPKGVGVVTPKISFGFFKNFTWLEGGDLKNFFKRTLPFKIFFYGKSFIWIHPRLVFGLGGSCFLFGLKPKCFSLGKNVFWKFLWKYSIAFGIILYHFQQISHAMTLVQIHSPKPSLTFGSWFASNPASWTSPCDYFHLNLIQTNFCLLF